MLKHITCTVCPFSCDVVLELDEGGRILKLSGNRCPRGKVYATKEHLAPERTLTTTVRVRGGVHPLVPVRTTQPIPREKLTAAMEATALMELSAPLSMGQVILPDFLGLGVDLIASRHLAQATPCLAKAL